MFTLGSLFSDLAGLGATALRDPLPFIIAVGIAVFSIATWFGGFRKRIAPAWHSTESAAAILRECASADEFVARYEELNQRLVCTPVVGPAWRSFADLLLLPQLPGQRVRCSVRPEVFFNEGLLSAAGLNLRFYKAFPNYVVGLGLLFTFMALTIALGSAAGSLGSDPQQMTGQLRALLETAAFKFVTSLFGLGCSILFSWRLNHWLHEFHKRVEDFCALLDERTDFVTAERIADEELTELRRQTEALERFNTDFAVSVAQALDERMNANVPQWIAPITGALGGLAEQMGTMNQDALGQMVESFADTVQGATKEQMAQLAVGLEEMRSALASVSERVGQSGQDFGKTLDAAGAQFSGNMETVAKNMESMLKVNTATLRAAIEPLAERAEQFGKSIHDLDTRIGEHVRQLQADLKELANVHGAIGRAAEQIEGATAPLSETLAAMQTASVKLEQTGSAIITAQDRLVGLNADLALAAQAVERAWNTHRERFEKVDDDLERCFEVLRGGLESYREQVQTFSATLAENLAAATRHLGGGVEELREAFDEFAEALQQQREGS